jgi:hypothetical protein
MFPLRAEGFFCNLDVLNEGLGIGKFECLNDHDKKKNFSAVNFLIFCHQNHGSGSILPKMLDPDLYQMNADPKP